MIFDYSDDDFFGLGRFFWQTMVKKLEGEGKLEELYGI